jgi:hypothetical protein
MDSAAIRPGRAGNRRDGHGERKLVPQGKSSPSCNASLEETEKPLRIDLVQVLPKLHALLCMLRDLKKRRDTAGDGS